MRVSALLRELNIALGTLRSYEPFLEDTDYKFNVLNQLIAEPIDKVFVCPNCDKHFNLNNMQDFDYGKKTAIQKFHINIFPQINNKQ